MRRVMLLGDANSLYEGDLRRLTRIIRAAITFFGVLLLAVIAFAGWSANQTAIDRERTLLGNGLNQSIASVLDGQKSVAWWDDAVVKVTDETVDLEFADANFGIFLTETYGHDEVYILSSDNKPIYAYTEGGRKDPSAFEQRRADISSVISEARRFPGSRLQQRPDEFGQSQSNYRILAGAVQVASWAGHIISVGGRPAVVAAITMVPNVEMNLLKGVPRLLVSVIYVDTDFISKMARTLLLTDLSLSPEAVAAPDKITEPFIGDDGIKVGYLSWKVRQPGHVLITIILPLVAFAVFATGLLSNHMFRRLWRASNELAQREARARHASRHDALSGLPNRPHMVEEVELRLATLDHAPRGTRAIAAYIDVDRFKDINDTLGHEAGDKLIQAVAKRLTARLRSDDFLARFGGDEFAVLCLSAEPSGDMLLAHRIASAFEQPFAIDSQVIPVTASVGIAMAPEHGRTADELLRHADIALYEAKNLGRNRAVSFSADMAQQVETRRSIEVDLRTAIEREELQLYYQPIVSCKTGAIIGAEALLRWNHPTRGVISPATFIPIAEISGLMPQLGTWTLERAIKDSKMWPQLEISVNLSPVQFTQSDLESELRRLTVEYDVTPKRFVLEITEGVLLEATDHTKSVLNAIQGMGFKTALDDFGTGYSSLAYLCNFKFDKIKIDRSFVSNVSSAQASRTIVQSVVSLGRGLGMQIVAEGVETEYEALMMTHFGCTELQGYFFSPAVAADKLGPLIAQFEPRHMGATGGAIGGATSGDVADALPLDPRQPVRA